jgi:hypothetical protein
VAVPLEVEAIAANPVEAGEGRVKLFAEILQEAGAVALNEAILGAVPLAEDNGSDSSRERACRNFGTH